MLHDYKKLLETESLGSTLDLQVQKGFPDLSTSVGRVDRHNDKVWQNMKRIASCLWRSRNPGDFLVIQDSA